MHYQHTHYSVLFINTNTLSVCGRTETGGAFSYKPTGADSSGVPSAGCLGDGPLPSREQGHATLPPAREAGLTPCVTLVLKQIGFHHAVQ